MRIERATAENFLGLKRLDVTLGGITVFAGDNWSGKSSLQQALRLALAGEVARVTNKGDYTFLVREGAKEAKIQVTTDDGVIGEVLLFASKSKNSSSSAIPVCQDPVVPALLDQHRFSEQLSLKQRRELIFQVGRVATEKDEVKRRLLEAGVSAELVEDIGPLLIQGFDGAVDYVADKLKTYRAIWKTATGESYGSEKAKDWKAGMPDPGIAEELPKRLESLALAEQQEQTQRQVVEGLRESASPAPEQCEQCNRLVSCIDSEALEARAALARQNVGLAMLGRATGNRRAAVEEAQRVTKALETATTDAEASTARATAAHNWIEAWSKLAELIAWDGIPSELAGKVVAKLNQRLTETAAVTKWPIVQIRDDMEITVGNRLWGLCSEAERWTADAAICESLAWVSGHKMLVLDRMDVLQPFRRGDFFDWLEKIQAEGVQSIVFATLKSKPDMEGVTAYWLEAGEVAR